MKVSELIAALQIAQARHGDLIAGQLDAEWNSYWPVEFVSLVAKTSATKDEDGMGEMFIGLDFSKPSAAADWPQRPAESEPIIEGAKHDDLGQ